MKLYLVRHGETDWNHLRRVQGREDIPLNAAGRMQAAATAHALMQTGAALVATSPLSRAQETADIIARALDSPGPVVEPGLIERDYGPLTGVPYPSGEDLYTFTERHPEGMETLAEVAARAMPVITQYCGQGRDAILVAHGGTINILLWYLTGGTLGYGVTKLKNACICVLEAGAGSPPRVLHCNLTADELAALYTAGSP